MLCEADAATPREPGRAVGSRGRPSLSASAGTGPASVVLVHGTRASHSQWDLQIPSLRAAGYRVLAPDLPGHGVRSREPFTLDSALTAIRTAIDEAAGPGGPTVHLVGSSLGGLLALNAAAADPAQLASLTLCGAAIQPTPWAARAYGRAIRVADLLTGHEAAGGRLLTLLLGVDGARALRRGGRAGVEVVGPAMEAAGSLDPLSDLHRIRFPVTFLHGRFDQLRVHEKRLAAAAPDGRLEVLPFGSHLALREPSGESLRSWSLHGGAAPRAGPHRTGARAP